MSIYYVSLGKNEYQIEINGNHLKLNGETIQAGLTALKERGRYLLRRGNWKREMHVEARGNNQYVLDSNGRHAVARVGKDGRKVRAGAQIAESDCTAPMPGMVVETRVTPGESVEKGQVLLILESMKMQMEMRAACAGTVSQVKVSQGTQVAKGDLLVKMDPETPPE